MSETRNKNELDNNIRQGVVIEALPNTMFRVEINDPEVDTGIRVVIAYLAGKMKFNRIRVLVGDKVDVLIDGYNDEKGRIVRRY
ncbi:translation initiation factor IF-1 [Candidatus Nomurabacteria bacterium RIFCSPLOWO2_01_FULL_36_10b]|uniref:Translation initiation factor IF-1 n=1 Tax=Candidatus Nomurabacteria bacterium RIFCSPLOWO2_01_FULL_36_10b TaxID=1801766 RepID=A0A1F6WNS9_9BACT|nr:MAG: translation initiation factor IF-1 [Candidatus Nomurabacteria bacterium RIFCSPLOWO2_01_FULL_36_10b]